MRFLPSFERRMKFGSSLKKRQLSWRGCLGLPLRIEPLEQRQMLSVAPVFLADLNPGSPSSGPGDFVEVDVAAFFVADDGINGAELWKSDGTAAGTVIVKDIFPGSDTSGTAYSSSPQDLTNVGGTLFFTAEDEAIGRELWTSDGTASGTVMVKDIDPDSFYDYPYSSNPSSLTDVDGTLFFSADDENRSNFGY